MGIMSRQVKVMWSEREQLLCQNYVIAGELKVVGSYFYSWKQSWKPGVLRIRLWHEHLPHSLLMSTAAAVCPSTDMRDCECVSEHRPPPWPCMWPLQTPGRPGPGPPAAAGWWGQPGPHPLPHRIHHWRWLCWTSWLRNTLTSGCNKFWYANIFIILKSLNSCSITTLR